MSSTGQNRIEWIDLGKGVCMFLVVFYHVNPMYQDISAHAQGVWREIVGLYASVDWHLKTLRMPLFFFLSGLLAYRAIQRPWQSIAKKRIALHLYLYLIWSLLNWLIIAHLAPNPDTLSLKQGAFYADGISSFVRQTLLGDNGLWYLYALPIYFCLCKTLNSLQPATILGLFTSLHIASEFFDLGFPLGAFCSNLVFFSAGATVGLQIVDHLQRSSDDRLLAGFGISILFYAIGHKIISLNAPEQSVTLILQKCFLLSAGIHFFSFAQPLLKKNLNWLDTVFCNIGRNTLQIYVFHYIFIVGINVYIAQRFFSEAGHLFYIVFPLASSAVVIALCLLASKALGPAGGVLFDAPFELRFPSVRAAKVRSSFE